MAIRRWEMLLSAQADSYLLKIQGDRTDVDRIVQAHSTVCQNVQEISEDTFQWAIFVVGATLAEKLAIQNQVMSLTTDAEGKKPSDSLLDVIEGLSGALQDLTNLTDDEQAYVMNKMARMGQASAAIPLGGATTAPAAAPPSTGVRPPTVPSAPRAPGVPGGGPGQPLPGKMPSAPGQPLPPVPGFTPGRVVPQPIPGRVTPGTPLPPVSIPGGLPGSPSSPGIVRPVQPPKSIGPAVPQTPLPPVILPKVTFPGVPSASKPAQPTAPPTAPIDSPRPPAAPVPAASLTPTVSPIEKPPLSSRPEISPAPTPPAEVVIEKRAEPVLSPRVEPLAAPTVKPQEPITPAVAPPSLELSPLMEIKPPPPVATSPGANAKQEEGQIQAAIFYPTEGEEWKSQFLNTLGDIALKKSKKPTHFKINASVAGPISFENSAEWIWKSKTSGADIFFVILPPHLGSDLMEPVVAEAESAGLRCFLVPQSEIQSKLLYMDLMV
ncbi:MAG: hypothetical protein KBD85_06245, partial [Elusimicrobia bacterium]|nr:hypothetical protein [Elusimicrobiota bacterium]